jgi:hypothetical protein
MRLHVMQVVQIDAIGPQNLQTPIQVAFEALVIPRFALACKKILSRLRASTGAIIRSLGP